MLLASRAGEAQGVPNVSGGLLKPVAKLDAGGIGDADHALEVRDDAGRVDHRLGAESLDHRVARLRKGLGACHDGVGERHELEAMR